LRPTSNLEPGVDINGISQGPLGRVLSVTGAQAQVLLAVSAQDVRATVGKFLGIDAGKATVVGVITKVCAQAQAQDTFATCTVDMLGEIKRDQPREFFQRGVTEYPMIGDGVEMITQDQLRMIFDMSGPGTIDIGTCSRTPRSPPTSMSTTWCASTSRCSAPPASASRAASRCCCARFSTRGRTCASS
jgi:hypothetical protein